MHRWARALGRTPRELLATVTAPEITEAMAFEQLEPFGSLHLEQLIGTLCAVMANPHRKEGTDPFSAADFMPALRAAQRGWVPEIEPQPLQMPTAEAQAELVAQVLFGGQAIPPRWVPPPGFMDDDGDDETSSSGDIDDNNPTTLE